MSDEELPPTDRDSPIGRPVIRGDEEIVGEHAEEAEVFDPNNTDDVEKAISVLHSFVSSKTTNPLLPLRAAAAAATLVRAETSYTDAATRVKDEIGVSFIRKWARVHDLPYAIRKQVAMGVLSPTAAKHIARLTGNDRELLAWTTIDNDLSVREVRSIVSDVMDGESLESAIKDHGIKLGSLTIAIDREAYCAVHREAALEDSEVDDIIEVAIRHWLNLST
ncbi:MAG: hypothetical protein ABEI06_10195 [Halobacteriaceae archaeon]